MWPGQSRQEEKYGMKSEVRQGPDGGQCQPCTYFSWPQWSVQGRTSDINHEGPGLSRQQLPQHHVEPEDEADMEESEAQRWVTLFEFLETPQDLAF